MLTSTRSRIQFFDILRAQSCFKQLKQKVIHKLLER